MNFDDIGAASLVIMQCASFDAYTQGMYVLMRHVFSLTWLYYLLIVCIGGFFVVNLFLAVLLEEFLQAKQAPSRTAALPVVHLPAHRQCPSSPPPLPLLVLARAVGLPLTTEERGTHPCRRSRAQPTRGAPPTPRRCGLAALPFVSPGRLARRWKTKCLWPRQRTRTHQARTKTTSSLLCQARRQKLPKWKWKWSLQPR